VSAPPANAWLVVAAWLGWIAGVGIALVPISPVALPAIDAEALVSSWERAVGQVASGRPALFVGGVRCPCGSEALGTVTSWARTEHLALHEVPTLSGMALADGEGRLRYVGDPAALIVHCGGLRGFRAWWSGPKHERPVLTAPCACAD
jgi:hypothetical protein